MILTFIHIKYFHIEIRSSGDADPYKVLGILGACFVACTPFHYLMWSLTPKKPDTSNFIRTKGLVTESKLVKRVVDGYICEWNCIITYSYYAIPFEDGDNVKDRYEIDFVQGSGGEASANLRLSQPNMSNMSAIRGLCIRVWGIPWSRNKKDATRLLKENDLHSLVDVYYNPKNEKQSVRYPGKTWGEHWNEHSCAYIGGFSFGLGSLFCYIALSEFRRRRLAKG